MTKVGALKKTNTTKTSNQTEKILIENFVLLQKVMTNLSEKFNDLSTQMSKLLMLFETSAKTIAQKDQSENQELIKKLDSLIEQNRTIARGIALLHEEVEEEPEQEMPQMSPKPMPVLSVPKPNIQRMQPPQIPPQMPPKPMPPMQKTPQKETQPQTQSINTNEYQKSISS